MLSNINNNYDDNNHTSNNIIIMNIEMIIVLDKSLVMPIVLQLVVTVKLTINDDRN